MRKVKVTLNGQEFEIQELRSRANATWRKKLDEPFAELAKLLKGLPGTSLTDGDALSNIVETVSGLLVGSVDTVVKLLIDYAPQLEVASTEAYDSELLDAFGSVLGLAYPFGGILGRVTKLTGSK
ncbi:MAG TPA: hypothetical protein VMX14_03820 [Anaerolineae bacterium]|nr:hypothetical protein [Anaerolineae bacterium]HUW11275.1 hypothetical protein [Anaerolineae bacterium]